MITQLKETSTASPAEGLDFVTVIPTLNEAESIGSAIDEIRGALQGFKFDILVVDGRSNYGTDRNAREAVIRHANSIYDPVK